MNQHRFTNLIICIEILNQIEALTGTKRKVTKNKKVSQASKRHKDNTCERSFYLKGLNGYLTIRAAKRKLKEWKGMFKKSSTTELQR